MDEVEGWVQLLFTYGPFALLVFFVFVTEAKARSALAEARPDGRRAMLAIYVANWLVIFALVATAVYAWTAVNLRREHVIEGRLEDLRGSEVVVTDERELYLSRTYLPGGRIDYKWRLVSDAPLPEGTRIPVFFQRLERRGDRFHEQVRIYELRVLPEFYERPVIIRYERSSGRLLLVRGDEADPLPVRPLDPATEEPAERPPRAMFRILRSAHAADRPDLKNLRERLEAYDPIVRYRATQAVQKAGEKALPEVTHLLAEPDLAPDTLRFALERLADAEALPPDALSGRTLETLLDALGHEDEAVRRVARRALLRHRSPALAQHAEEHLARLREQGTQEAMLRAQRAAPALLDLFYNVGIEEKDRYASVSGAEAALLASALGRFDRAWALRGLVPEQARAEFAKALWGKALALHDRSWLERARDGTRDEALVGEAVAAFETFLHEVQARGVQRYPYPHHLPAARAYVANPQPESLTERFFVIAGSYWREQRASAERQARELRAKGVEANVIDTDGYPNLRSGLWSVVLGPFSRERAQAVREQLGASVADAYVKAGW